MFFDRSVGGRHAGDFLLLLWEAAMRATLSNPACNVVFRESMLRVREDLVGFVNFDEQPEMKVRNA
jgi:hypothetical protein